ncbi:hypothetical protein CWE08_11645 [Aliidiomarina iranensis]|uniref:Ankyrin repeat domain-containing protein n=1 Tax=Aliidiomarina iranensis TaxID=1434071 RepID=A0A432VQE5_9GAMM|nr:hypothetical protein [Aliidiomarina iranensis]RUO18300.1 hypothetical protein CWE08_11645 [Aliidiomarina iranensis]
MLLIIIVGKSIFFSGYSPDFHSLTPNEIKSSESDIANDTSMQSLEFANSDPANNSNIIENNIDLELFRGLSKTDLMRRLIETGNFTPDILLALVERNLIDVNEILRDDHPNGSEHYTPLFAALVTGEATNEHIQAFIDHGAYIDPSLEGWNYIIAKENNANADILIQHAKYDHKSIWEITELAFHFRNMALFRHLAEQNQLPGEQLDSLIEATAARLAQSKNTGAPTEPLVEQIQYLQALTSLNSEQALWLLELEKTLEVKEQ